MFKINIIKRERDNLLTENRKLKEQNDILLGTLNCMKENVHSLPAAYEEIVSFLTEISSDIRSLHVVATNKNKKVEIKKCLKRNKR